MDKYKLEKLRQQYEEARIAYYTRDHDCRIEYALERWDVLEALRNKYFEALDFMSQKEGVI